jgi:hypothetical protein
MRKHLFSITRNDSSTRTSRVDGCSSTTVFVRVACQSEIGPLFAMKHASESKLDGWDKVSHHVLLGMKIEANI